VGAPRHVILWGGESQDYFFGDIVTRITQAAPLLSVPLVFMVMFDFPRGTSTDVAIR
jgi:hypothetical protein